MGTQTATARAVIGVTDVRWLHGVRVAYVRWLRDVRVTDVGWLHGVQVKHRQQH